MLLAPFRCVVTLRVLVALAADVERALRSRPVDHPLGEPLLPALRELVLPQGSDESTLSGSSLRLRRLARSSMSGMVLRKS